MKLTPAQEQIVAYLEENPDRDVTATELRDVFTPKSGVKTIHVQIHHIRKAGVKVTSRGTPYPGYRLDGRAM